MKNLFSKMAFLALVFVSIVVVSCKKEDNHDHGSDQEQITTATITFSLPGGVTATASWRDIDGAGGNSPVIDTLVLNPITTPLNYTATISFLDESKTPALNVTEEVQEKSDEHLLVLQPSANLNWLIVTNDKDKNGKDLGLNQTVTVAGSGNGTLRVVLKHEPDKNASNPLNTGETDLDIIIPVRVN